MKKIIPIIILSFIHPYTFGAGSPEAEVSLRPKDEGEKYNVVFYGSLESQAGNKYDIEYITWDHQIKKIEVYEMPKKEMYDILSPTRNRLKNNPILGGGRPGGGELIKHDLNLVDIKKVEVPDREVIWVYSPDENAKDCGEKTRYKDIAENPKSTLYIEIIVTDVGGKVDHYLAKRTQSFNVSQKRRTDSQEIDLPDTVALPSVKTITIDGYRDKEKTEDKLRNGKKRNRATGQANNIKQSKKIKTARVGSKNSKNAAIA